MLRSFREQWREWVLAVVLWLVLLVSFTGVGEDERSHVAFGVAVLIAAVVLVGATRGRRWGCALLLVAVNAAMWGCWVMGTGFLDGWNRVPEVAGVVMDAQSGETLAGVRVWRGWVRDAVGWKTFEPGGAPSGYWTDMVELVTGRAGRFSTPGFVTLHGVRGMVVGVYAPGYEAAWYEFAFGQGPRQKPVRLVGVGNLGVGSGEACDWGGGRVWIQVGAGRLELEIAMARLGVAAAGRWERHLRCLATYSAAGGPFPRGVLLDEAYRYVSGGGELTEGILSRLMPEVVPWYPNRQLLEDPRVRAIIEAVAARCTGRTAPPWCDGLESYLADLKASCQDSAPHGDGR